MKSSKYMFFGVFLVALAAWMAALSGNDGSYLGGFSIVLAPLGSLLFLIGFFGKSNK